MTAEDYFAYVQDYQARLFDARLLARAGLADASPEEQEEMEMLYEEEDPFEEQAFVFRLESLGCFFALEPSDESILWLNERTGR